MDMTFIELWKLSTDKIQKEPNVTNKWFIIFGRKQRDNEGMKLFLEALSDLNRGCYFGDREESIVRDVLVFNIKTEEVKKQLCMETMGSGKR